jgi:SAM-dependent methyltransferase
MQSVLSRFLDQCPEEDCVSVISEHRPYQHDEGQYDAQYRIDPFDYLAGEGVAVLAREEGIDLSHPILEFGCGTGRLSVGLLRHFPSTKVVVTDASMAFLRLARAKFDANDLHNYRLALLRFEDVSRLPDSALSLVVLRSALHHVADYEDFILEVGKKLVPGGALVFQEPCFEGFLIMGLLAESVLGKLGEGDAQVREQVKLFADTMRFYCRRDVDKSAAEDKHVFRLADLLQAADKADLHLRYVPNADLESFARPGSAFDFHKFLADYLTYCMAMTPPVVARFMLEAKPLIAYLADVAGGSLWPESSAVSILRRKAVGRLHGLS